MTQAVNISPLIGPSRTKGATMPSWRRPARKVRVFQCPCGTWAVSLLPFAAQPQDRVMLVLIQVSSVARQAIAKQSAERG